MTEPPLTCLCHSFHAKSQRNVPPPTRLSPPPSLFYSSPSSSLSSLALSLFSRLISVILHNPICLSIMYPLWSQPPPLLFLFCYHFSPSSLCLFSSLHPVLDTASGTQIMSDVYKTGLSRITFTHNHMHAHTRMTSCITIHTLIMFIHNNTATSMWTVGIIRGEVLILDYLLWFGGLQIPSEVNLKGDIELKTYF